MLKMSYIKFMKDLEEEIKRNVGIPFQVKIDITVGIPQGKDDMKEKLENFTKLTLQPIINSIPKQIVMS